MLRIGSRVTVSIVTAALFAAAAHAQTSSGAISGRVVDSTGLPVAGAQVRLVNQVLKDARTFTSTAGGDFVFTEVQPGTYSISVKMDGFKQFEQTDLQLSANDRLAIGDLKLQVGAVTESIEVKATGAQVQTESAERSGLLDSKQVMELMARGRDVMALLQTMPGVVDDATGGDTLGQFSTPTMQGIRQNYNALNIDGISGNTARGRTAESPVNMDAIAEVRVLTNSYTAEYGTASGGVINIVTRGGSQSFHGAAYYYNRNEAFNANDFFANRQGVVRPRYRYNTAGGNLGGPIYWPGKFNADKQKLFFFFSMEDLPNQKPNSVSNFTVPTELERKGDFSQSYRNATTLYAVKDPLTGLAFPGNVIPASRIDPNSSKLLNIFPLPNATNTAVTKFAYNYQIAGYQKQPVKNETLRVDYNRSEKMRLWFKAVGFSSDNTGRTSPAINNQWGLADVDYAQTMPQLGANVTYIISPTLVNQATFGINLWTEQQKLSDEGLKAYQRATYGINIKQQYPENNPLNLLPAISLSQSSGGVNNAANVSYDGRFPMVDDSMMYSFSDSLTKIWNQHEFKFGFLMQRVQYNQYHQAGGNSFPGAFNFTVDTNNANPNDAGYAYANAILGNFNSYSEVTNRVDYAPITRIVEWFGQDHWKVARGLTIDAGLRFTWARPQDPANGNAGNFVPWLYDRSKAPTLFMPAVVGGKKVTINPLTGAQVPAVYAGLIVPGTGDPSNGVLTPTTPGYPHEMVYSNGVIFAPRFGLAYDPWANGKTAIRLGGGVFYSPRLDAGTLGNLFFNPPAIFTPTKYYGTVPTATDGAGLLSPNTFSRDIDPHAKVVTAYHANFGIQRSIGWGTVLDVAYVGTFGRHLGANKQLNTVPYGAQFLPQNQNPQSPGTPLNDNYFRPYPGNGNIPQQVFESNSSYHSLQIQANRRFAKGVWFGANYTRSKALAYTDGDSTTGNNGTNLLPTYVNPRVWNYGTPSYDRPNVVRVNFLLDVPRLSRLLPNPVIKAVFDGWQVSEIASFLSGRPMGITMGTSPNVNFAGGGDGVRPLMVGNPNLPKDQRTFDEYFNTLAFAEPVPVDRSQCTTAGCPPMTVANLGNMPLYPFRGPGVNNWNTSLFKNFIVKEKVRVQFRAEAYNTFNHTQFDGVDTTLTFNAAGVNTRSTSGQLNSSRDPRIMQFALRLMF
jgi:hypothetical protein